MKKLLWLPSWYPNKEDPFLGDFIQRHARAASIYNQIYVIYITKTKNDINKSLEEKTLQGNLTEQMIYYTCQNGFFCKITSLINYFLLNRKYIKEYIRQYGKPDYVHVHVTLKAGIIALWLKYRFKISFLLTEHYGIYNDIVEDAFKSRSFLFRYFTRLIIKESQSLVSVSKQMGENINELIIAKPYSVIPNVVDTNLFYYTPVTDNSIFRFIHISNMVSLKNVEGIIEAVEMLWKQRQDFELYLVGPITDSVQQAVNKSLLLNKAIYFTGEISYANVARKLRRAHALLLFSNTENQPCVMLESLCCGRPVIATAVGGIPEVVNESNGFLIKPKNVKILEESMQYMIDSYSSFDLPVIAKQASSIYSYDVVGKQFYNIYSK